MGRADAEPEKTKTNHEAEPLMQLSIAYLDYLNIL